MNTLQDHYLINDDFSAIVSLITKKCKLIVSLVNDRLLDPPIARFLQSDKIFFVDNALFIRSTYHQYMDILDTILRNQKIAPIDRVQIKLALRVGGHDLLQKIIKKYGDIWNVSPDDSCVCISSSNSQYLSIVKLLISDGYCGNVLIKSSLKYGNLDFAMSLMKGEYPDIWVPDLSFDNNYLIGYCSGMGYVEIIQFMLSQKTKVDPNANNGLAIRSAVSKERYEIVKLLLSYNSENKIDFDLSINDNEIIWFLTSNYSTRETRGSNISQDEYLEIIELLLRDERVKITDFNFIISHACFTGDLKFIKLLFENGKHDPSRNNNVSIIAAATGGHVDIVSFLCDDERVDKKAGLKAAVKEGKGEVITFLMLKLIGRLLVESEMMRDAMSQVIEIPKDIIRKIQMDMVILEM